MSERMRIRGMAQREAARPRRVEGAAVLALKPAPGPRPAGARWEETLAYLHEDNDLGSVAGRADILEQARALGRRLIESDPLPG